MVECVCQITCHLNTLCHTKGFCCAFWQWVDQWCFLIERIHQKSSSDWFFLRIFNSHRINPKSLQNEISANSMANSPSMILNENTYRTRNAPNNKMYRFFQIDRWELWHRRISKTARDTHISLYGLHIVHINEIVEYRGSNNSSIQLMQLPLHG